MSNPIDNGSRVNRSNVPATDAQSKPANNAGDARVERTGGKSGADASQQSERLKAVREAIDQTPEVDATRVESIKQQIAQGEYPLDADRVADRFAEYEKLLND